MNHSLGHGPTRPARTRAAGRDRLAGPARHGGTSRLGGATLLVAAALLLSAPAGRAAPAAPGWLSKTKGLEVRGLSSLRISVRGSDEVWYASVLGRGVCSSADRGKTWKAIGQGIDAKASDRDRHELTLDPKDDKVLYDVVRGKIWRSANAGGAWEYRGNGTVTRSFDRRHAKEWVAGVVVDPSKPAHLLAGTRTRAFFGGLFESDNGGASWTQIAGTGEKKLDESGLSHDAWPIALDPRSDKYVVVGGARGSAWTSEDRGRHFKRTDPGGAGHHTCHDLAVPRTREILLAETRGLFRSRDGGNAWGKEPLLAGVCVAVDFDPANPKRVYALVRGRGLFHTEDVAKWPGGAKHLETDPHDVVCHPRAKNVVYLTSETTGLWESSDKGETFGPIAGDLPAVVPAVALVAGHPADGKRMLASDDHGTTFLSQDGGDSWSRVGSLGAPVARLLGDPAAPGAWIAAGSELYRSVDSGATWSVARKPADPTDRIADVQLLADGLLVLWERDGRVERVGGAFSARPTQSKGSWAQALSVDPADPKHWLVAMRSVREEWSKDDEDGGAYETRDGGATWARMPVGAGVENGNRGVVASIDASGAAWYGADGGGLYRRDAAKDAPWQDVTPTTVPKPWWFNAFLVSGAAGGPVDVVLQAESAGSEVRSLVRSGDGGKTWVAMADPGARLASMSVDPTTPGRYLAGDVSGDRGVLVYDTPGAAPPAPGAPPRPPEGAQAPVLPAEGVLGVSVAADGTARLFDAREGKPLAALGGHEGGVLSVAVARDGSLVYTGGADRTIAVWDAAGTRVRTLAGHPTGHEGAVTALALSPDGKRLWSGDAQWRVLAWDLEGAKDPARLEGHTGAVTALAVSPDGTRVFSASSDGSVRTWDAASGSPRGRLDLDAEVLCLALSPDGATLFAGARDAAIRVFDAATQEPRGTVDAGMPAVFALASARGGSLLAAGLADGVHVFGADGKPGAALTGGTGPALALAASPDGSAVAAGFRDGTVRVWGSGEPGARWTSPAHGGAVLAVALSPYRPASAPGAQPPTPAPPARPRDDVPKAGAPKAEGPPPGEPAPPSPQGPAPSNPPAMK